MNKGRIIGIAIGLLTGIFGAATPALGQSRVWQPAGTADWNVGSNWGTGTVPVSGSAVFIINGGTAQLSTSGAGQYVYLGQGTGNGNLQVLTGADLTVDGFLIGRDNARAGTLTVSGGSIAAGELFVGDGRGGGGGGSGTATISGGTITLSNQFQIGAASNASGTVNMNGGTVSTPNLRVGDAGKGTLVQNDGTFTVTGTDFRIANNSTQNSTMNLQGGTMNATSATIQVGGSGSGTGGVGLFAGGTLNAAGVLVAANSTFTDLGGVLNVTGGITNNGTWIFSPSTAHSVSYSIGGTGGVTKNGAGILTLAAANTYTGDTTLNVANIRLGINNAISTNSVFRFGATDGNRRLQLQGFDQTLGGVDDTAATGGNLFVDAAADNTGNAPATLTLNVAAAQSYTFSGRVQDAYNGANSVLTLVKSGAGTQVLSGGANVSYSGTTTVNAGVLEFGGTNTVANNSAMTVNSGGTVRFSGGGTRSLAIAGAGNVEKTGDNLLTLSGVNTYTGTTTVSAGGLIINGSTAAGSAVSVAAGARLGGGGTIGGDLTLADGAFLAFNPSLSLTVSGEVTLDNRFGVASLVNADGTAIDWSSVANNTAGYTLINTDSTFNNIANFGLAQAEDIGGGRKAYFENGSLKLVVIPEPATLGLFGVVGVALFAFRRMMHY